MNAATVSHVCMVKTSDQPSFSSVNFSPFTSAEAFRSIIRYQPCAKPELNPNSLGGTSMKITSSSYKKYFEATQKLKI
jgi:hypothetical protein